MCCKNVSRIHVGRNPCAQHHPACPNHARTACSCSHELRPTCCLLGRHVDDSWSSPASASRCRGHRLCQASETKVEMSRSAARYAPSWPRPRRPSPWHALSTREPLSSPDMGHGSLAPLTSHGTRSLPMCPAVRVDRVRVHVPAAIPVFRLHARRSPAQLSSARLICSAARFERLGSIGTARTAQAYALLGSRRCSPRRRHLRAQHRPGAAQPRFSKNWAVGREGAALSRRDERCGAGEGGLPH